MRLPQLTGEQRNHRFRKGDLAIRVRHVFRRQTAGDHHQRHVADHLGRRRDLHDVAEHAVDLGIGPGDLGPALVVDAERARLFAQIGVLPAGDLVVVDVGRAGPEIALEGAVEVAHLLPIGRQRHHRIGVDPRVAGGMAERGDDRAEAGLRGEPAHRIHRRVDGVDPGLDRGEHAGGGDPAGIVGVEVDRDADLPLQRLDEDAGGRRLAQPRHVLETEDMGARRLQLAGQRDVVVEVVFRAAGIGDVAGVADRRLAEPAGLQHRIHRRAHVLDPVERIEDAEQVDPALRRLAHEIAHHVVGIGGVADAVRGAQQHLGQQVGHRRAQPLQTLPRAFVEKAHRHVEGGAAPALDREELGQHARIGRRDGRQVVAAHPCGQQRLVGVAERGVGHQHPVLVEHPAGEAFGPERVEALARAVRNVQRRRPPARPGAWRVGGSGLPSTAALPLTITSPT